MNWLEYAKEIGKGSNCFKKVGAILVSFGALRATATNKAPITCYTYGCQLESNPARGCRGVHAERVLVDYCLERKIDLRRGIVYVSREPCEDCQRLLFSYHIEKIVSPKGEIINQLLRR